MAQLLNNSRVYGKLTVDTMLTVNGGNTSTNTTSGSVVIEGGLGVSENVFAGAIHSDNYFYLDGTPILSETSSQINLAYTHANAAFNTANSALGGTATDGWARNTANAAFDKANNANNLAQLSFDAANNSLIYTDNAIANLVNSAPITLDTLNELAAALGDDANFSTTILTNIGIVGSYANSAFDQANTANTQAWIAYDEAVNANTFVRQRADAASSYANGAFIQANSAIVLAQAAFDQANTANTTSGGSDLTTILTTLYSPPTGDYGLVTQSNYSYFGEFIAISYDLKTTFPEGNGLLEIDWGSV